MEQVEIVVFVIVGVVFLTAIVLAFVTFILQYRRKQNEHFQVERDLKNQLQTEIINTKFETQEATFNHLGKELHDNIGQLLSSAQLLIGITERSLENPPDTLVVANDTLSKAIGELRLLSKSLSTDWLQQFSFIENLTTEIKRISASKIVTVVFNHPAYIALEADSQIVLFRVVQEIIQNAVKHARAQVISINVVESVQALEIVVQDNGVGFDFTQVKKGLGIMNIQHRVELLKGNVQWLSNSSGTKVVILLPINKSDL